MSVFEIPIPLYIITETVITTTYGSPSARYRVWIHAQGLRKARFGAGGLASATEVPGIISAAGQNFLHRFHAPRADGRVLGVRSYIRLPMPAALAFGAVRSADRHGDFVSSFWFDFQLRHVQQFPKRFLMLFRLRQHLAGANKRQFRLQGLADLLRLPRLL